MEKLDNNKPNKDKETKKDGPTKVVNKLTEEEEEMKKNIEDMIEALFDLDFQIKTNAYNMLKKEITGSTNTQTSIPKPLKFMRQHYQRIKDAYLLAEGESKKLLGDLLCILVLVTESTDTSLMFILENNLTEFADWGVELVRTLFGQLTTEYLKRLDDNKPFDDLLKLINLIVKTLTDSGNENEAIDLLLEIDMVDDIKNHCSEKNYKKICQYLIAISNYSAESTEQKKILEIVYELYSKFNEPTNALRIAIKLKEKNMIKSTILTCNSKATQIQMAFILGRSKFYFESNDLSSELSEIIKNLKQSEHFKALGRSLDISAPKNPEEVFKSHLEEKKDGIVMESYKVNMSTSLVSSLINAGYGTEKLISNKDNDWLSKNKEEGLLVAISGLGLVNLWDIECGPNELEKYMDVNEMNPFKRGGYNLGIGILSSGVNDENNTAFALLNDQVNDKK